MKRLLIYAILTALCALALAGCAAGAENDDGGLRIVTTNFVCYDIARAVAGDRAEITMLIKPGADVHTFEPTPAGVAAMLEADIFIYIGGESDVWADGMLASMDDGPLVVRMFDCVEALTEEDGAEHGHDGEEYDEHIWTSPENAARMVRHAAESIISRDPDNADVYNAAAEGYIAEIEAVDARIQAIVDGAARHELVFADRFPFLYLANQYGLSWYAAFPGCAAETEPSARVLMEMVDRVTSEGIPAVYTIELSSGAIAQMVAQETGAEILTLHAMQNVTAEEFAAGETYISIMNKNAEALERGLN